MKLTDKIVLGLFLMLGLGSCKENMEHSEDMGTFKVNVEKKEPVASRAVSSQNTSDFPVAIQGKPGTPVAEVSKSFASVAQMPVEPIVLPVGFYTVSAHSPFALEKTMAVPYYAGESNMEILEGTLTKSRVTCKMKNSRIQLVYGERFKSSFSSWTITVTNGDDVVATFTDANKAPAPVFLYFGEKGTESIIVNVKAEMPDGNTIRDSRVLTKKQADESYADDNQNFAGGDGMVLNMDISETSLGYIKIDVSVKIEFTEHSDDIQIEVGDKEEEVDPDQPGGDPSGPVQLQLPENFGYSLSDPSTRPASLEAKFITPAGLKSAKVTIVTDNMNFENILKDAAFDQPGQLLKGAELIGNKGIQELFTSLELKDASGQPKKTPVLNDKEYIFPLSAFYQFLDMFTGNHQFLLVVEDANGAKAEGVLQIKIAD